FVSAAEGGRELRFWEADKEFPIDQPPLPSGGINRAPLFSSNGKKLLVGADQNVFVLDPETRKVVSGATPQGVQALVLSLPTTPRGTRVDSERVLGYGFSTTNTPMAAYLIRVHVTGQPTVSYIVVAEIEGTGRLVGKPIRVQSGFPQHALLHPDGKNMVVLEGKNMYLVDLAAGVVKGTINGPFQEPKCFALSPDGKILLTSH